MAFHKDSTVANAYVSAGSSFAYTVNALAERLLIVRISIFWTGTAITVTGATYGGVALSLVGRTIGTNVTAEIWALKNPASGSNTLAWTLTGSTEHVVGATGMAGINQTNPYRNFTGASGNSLTPTLTQTGTTVEHYVFDVLAARETATANLTATVGSGQTQDFNLKTTSGAPPQNNVLGAGSMEAGSAGGSVVMNWTLSSARPWALCSVEVLPVVEGEVNLNAVSVMTPYGSAKFSGKVTMTAQGLVSIDGLRVRLGFVTMAGQSNMKCEPVFPQGDAYLPVTLPQVLFMFPASKEFKMVWVLQELNRPKRVDLGGLESVTLRINGLPDKACVIEDANDGVAVYFTLPYEFTPGWWTGKLIMKLLNMWDSGEPPDPQEQAVSQDLTVETPEFLIYVKNA